MRDRPPPNFEEGRVHLGYYSTDPGRIYGQFIVQGPCGEKLGVMSSGPQDGWEHVSVSTRRRVPNWEEMCFVKNAFWLPNECVMQLHPPEADYVNIHPNCLHLWRPLNTEIPMPPPEFV